MRELENAIERSVIVAKGTEIQPQDLPRVDSRRGGAVDDVLGAAASHARGDRAADDSADAAADELEQAEAASILGLYRPTLYSKMRKHDIRDPRTSAVADEA